MRRPADVTRLARLRRMVRPADAVVAVLLVVLLALHEWFFAIALSVLFLVTAARRLWPPRSVDARDERTVALYRGLWLFVGLGTVALLAAVHSLVRNDGAKAFFAAVALAGCVLGLWHMYRELRFARSQLDEPPG